jgi:hypothetical protein
LLLTCFVTLSPLPDWMDSCVGLAAVLFRDLRLYLWVFPLKLSSFRAQRFLTKDFLSFFSFLRDFLAWLTIVRSETLLWVPQSSNVGTTSTTGCAPISGYKLLRKCTPSIEEPSKSRWSLEWSLEGGLSQWFLRVLAWTYGSIGPSHCKVTWAGGIRL